MKSGRNVMSNYLLVWGMTIYIPIFMPLRNRTGTWSHHQTRKVNCTMPVSDLMGSGTVPLLD